MRDYYDNKELVRTRLDRADIYEQLAEEAAELAQAACKMARYLRGRNPTPKSYEELLGNLIEELSDMKLVELLLDIYPDANIVERKLARWAERLEEHEHEKEEKTMMEFSVKQERRIDEIHNAVYELCKVLTEKDDDLVWNMEYIGEIADVACDILVDKGFRIRYPAHVTEKDGTEYITDWHNEDHRDENKEHGEYE